jgi:thiamine phosphate synthase YjbQ (UPF0047 family)
MKRTLLPMRSLIKIVSVERDGDDGLVVLFSDGTTGAFVVEELLELRPQRDLAKPVKRVEPVKRAKPTLPASQK